MSARPEANPFPSIEEFPYFYNIPDQYDDRIPIWRSVDQLPEFGFPELCEVYRAAVKWFARAVPPPQNAPFDPLAEFEFFPRDETDDRTLSIDDVDFARLNIRLLRRIQQEFLGRYPLWRVHLVGEDASTSIVVYPTVIRFGSRPADVDPEAALRELVPHGVALREERLRPRRAYIAQLQRLLPDAVRAIGDRLFLVFGVLDNYAGDYSRLAVCVLSRGPNRIVDMEGPAGSQKDLLWADSGMGVSAEGALTSSNGAPETTAFYFRPWLPPADFRGPLLVVERESGNRHTFELKSENIIRALPGI